MVLQTLSEFSAFRISCVCITSACLCVLSSAFSLRCERYLFNHICISKSSSLLLGEKKGISINPQPELRSFCPCRFRHLGWPEAVVNCPGIYVVFSCHSSSLSDYPIRSLDLLKLQRRSWCTRYQRSCSFHRFVDKDGNNFQFQCNERQQKTWQILMCNHHDSDNVSGCYLQKNALKKCKKYHDFWVKCNFETVETSDWITFQSKHSAFETGYKPHCYALLSVWHFEVYLWCLSLTMRDFSTCWLCWVFIHCDNFLTVWAAVSGCQFQQVGSSYS